jgi:cytolysin (calcineurin-like family phosphatase)
MSARSREDGIALIMTSGNTSAVHVAHGSLRVQGTAFAIGHASGVVAATAALQGVQPRRADVRKVQATLVRQRANLDLDALDRRNAA